MASQLWQKTVLSAITTIVHLFPYNVSHLQQNSNLSPRHWLYQKDISSLLSQFSNYLNKFSTVFRKLRIELIENRQKRVLENHTEGLTGPTDTIEEGVRGWKRKREEEHPVVTSRIQVDPYSFVDHHHGGKPTVIMGNPVSKNPCSFFESVKDVFKKNYKEWYNG